MIVVNSVEALQKLLKNIKSSIGFVPTMGALHEGHISLIRKAREENDKVIVSIFVNPTQFLEGEDLDKYPRKDEADKKICELSGVDILFMPTIDKMYQEDELKILAPAIRGFILEGAKRVGHFDGVLQIVMKLFNIILNSNSSTHRAYFGKKDAQQLALITQMVKNYFMNIEIIPCDIIRDSDGLALSSRNVYLSKEERERALSISRSLKVASQLIMQNQLDTKKIINEMRKVLSPIEIDYIAIVNREFREIKRVEVGNSIILVAGYVGNTRLIDNIWV